MNDTKKKMSLLCLIACVLISAALCFGQIASSKPVIVMCLVLFLALIVYSVIQDAVFPVLLYFLPWATLLKASYSGISVYTIALIAVCVLTLFKRKFRFDTKSLILALLIFVFSLAVKLINGKSPTLDYIKFIFMLALFPLVCTDGMDKSDFRMSTLFFTVGIIIAALTAQRFAKYPNISRFIDVYSWSAVTRYSGYYGDANFYSAQVSAALGGWLFMVLTEKKPLYAGLYFIPIVVLAYCGAIAASKTFLIVFGLMLFVWLISLYFSRRRRPIVKIAVTVFVALSLLLVFCTDIFSDSLAVMKFRLQQSTNLSSFSTHRSELWLNYYNAFADDVRLLFFGQGITKSSIGSRASHSTLIQIIYQLGLIGGSMLLIWGVNYFKLLLAKKPRRKVFLALIMLMIGIFLPWLSIDMLLFDEFFLLPVYFSLAVNMQDSHPAPEALLSD